MNQQASQADLLGLQKVIEELPSHERQGYEASRVALMEMTKIDSEQALLGACLIDHDTYYDVANLVKAEHFTSGKHVIIWNAIVAVEKANQHIDLVTVTIYVQNLGQSAMDALGGAYYLSECLNYCPDYHSAITYAELMIADYDRRKMISALETAASYTMNRAKPMIEVKEKVAEIIESVSRTEETGQMVTIKELANKGGDRALSYKLSPSGMRGPSIGIPSFDKLFCGLLPDDFLVICGLTSSGKSTLFLQILMALANQIPGAFYPTEMGGDALMDRLACLAMGISYDEFLRGNIPYEIPALLGIYSMLGSLPLYIYDKSSPSPMEILLNSRALIRKGLIGWVGVDGINDVSGSGDIFEKTSVAAEALHDIAYNKTPVIATCHATRKSTERAMKEPTLYDVQGSIRISQLCTRFIGIHRVGYEVETGLAAPKKLKPGEVKPSSDLTSLRIGKDRPTGKVGKISEQVFIRGKQGYRFEEAETQETAPIINNRPF